MNKIKKLVNRSKSFSEFFNKYINYLRQITEKINRDDLNNFFDVIDKARKKNRTIFVAGNGGSAANALTTENDLGFDVLKRAKTKKTFRVMPLVSNPIILTSISNDISFDQVFLNQLKIHYKKGDILLLLSGTGNSKNLINAAKWVKKNKGTCIAVLGGKGGKLRKICNPCIIIKTEKDEFGPVEDSQLIINHSLSHWFQLKLKR